MLSLTWWALLRYYRRLNKAKFRVILDIETRLPEKPYTREWAALHPDEAEATTTAKKKGVQSWFRRQRHREASVVEQVVPFVFCALYLVLVIRVIWLR